jgi:ribose/xylose/arabinose/galactoside ABC-type transport system permease subunit
MEPPPITFEPAGEGAPAPDGGNFYRDARWRLGCIGLWLLFECVVLVVVMAIGAAVSRHFLTLTAVEGMLPSLLMLGLMAPPMVMIVAAGGVDLSVGAVAALAGVLVAMREPAAGLPAALLLGLSAAVAVGVVNAVLVGLVRLHPVIVTLAMTALLRGLAMLLADGEKLFLDDSALLGALELRWPFWIVLAVVVLGSIPMAQLTPFGLRPGPGEPAESRLLRAVYVGGPYVLSSAMAGLAGIVFLTWARIGDPTAGMGWELEVLLAVLIGGTRFGGRFGSVIGAVIGVVIVASLHLLLTLAGMMPSLARLTAGASLLAFALLGSVYQSAVASLYRASRARMAQPPGASTG